MTDSQPTLGEYLRQERERKGITIEQVASATKISVRLLHLLESDQYVELPAKPFIRGFVMSYCRFIGIDAKEVLIRYGEFLEEHSHDRPARDEGHSGYAFERREGDQSRTTLSIVMGAFVVLGAIALVVLKPSLHHHHNSRAARLREANARSSLVGFQETPVPTAVPSVLVFPAPSPSTLAASEPRLKSKLNATPQPSPKPKASPKPKTSPKPIPRPSAAAITPKASPSPSGRSEKPDPLNSGVNLKPSDIKFKVVFKTSADVWVRYQADDRPRMKFILRAGKVLVLRGQNQILFQCSNPSAITFRINSGPRRGMEHDSNVVMRGADLTLVFPKQLIGSIGDPFPGQRPLLNAHVPPHAGPHPQPSPSL